MKLTVFSLLVLSVILTFAGVEPLAAYKDSLMDKWGTIQTSWTAQREERRLEEAEKQETRLQEAKLAAEEEAKRKAEEAVQAEEAKKREEQEAKLRADEEAGLVYLGAPLQNPSWQKLKTFLLADDTDKMEYVYPTTVCFDFASKLQRNAKEAGWRCAIVRLDMTGYTDPYNYGIAHDAGHACNAFETTDRGLVYIDCTRGQGGSPLHQDRIVDIQIGKQYNPKHIFPSSGWYVPEGQMGVVRGMSIQW